MQIRLAQEQEDLTALIGLFDEFLGDENRWFALSAQEESDLVAAIFEKVPLLQVLVAEDAGKIVGYAAWNWNYTAHFARPALYLNVLYVTPNSRHQGIGSRLLQHVARAALEHKCLRLEWRLPENSEILQESSEIDKLTQLCQSPIFDLYSDILEKLVDETDGLLAKRIFKTYGESMINLKKEAIEIQLKSVPKWKRNGDIIERKFAFHDFVGAMVFVNRVAQISEENVHHPDIDIRYNKVRLSLTTHDSGGLTKRDFALAQEIDNLTGTENDE